ncbi:Cu(I)-responsive transcriptional regulator [Devosia pacifica]|uniref:Cu(I)-responsive transcriptional regulator n=1 Tax=Devosia pacifica TaxID=1335967 RepID=A0A918VWG0_9HYPH|nr:Cu(I)-responsive transcriptional regulator [Devosia pacifica]GHA29741.1 Cu(I)-responsive transcriptional regulator [Devosia pacifica]
MNIGEAAAASGVTAKMIRYYESIGLLPEAKRSENNYRVYDARDVHTLRFIKRARSLGFSMEETTKLLQLWQNRARTSAEVKQVALAHIEDLETRIENLQAMANTLRHLASCCSGNERPDCPILDDLAGKTRKEMESQNE